MWGGRREEVKVRGGRCIKEGVGWEGKGRGGEGRGGVRIGEGGRE